MGEKTTKFAIWVGKKIGNAAVNTGKAGAKMQRGWSKIFKWNKNR